jgi:hypothetical protein
MLSALSSAMLTGHVAVCMPAAVFCDTVLRWAAGLPFASAVQ